MSTDIKTTEKAGLSQNLPIQYVRDIPADYDLVSDSQDIDATLESIGKSHMKSDVGCLFVQIKEGEYTSVYYSERSTPFLTNLVYKLEVVA